MSVALFIEIEKNDNDRNKECVDVIPVSFERVWDAVWMRAISECNIRVFVYFRDFSVRQIPEVLDELDRIYDWVQINGGKDTEYISWRIHDELKPFLYSFIRNTKMKSIGLA